MGILYGISVGSGAPELLTLKAVRLINSCKVIAVPRTKGENTLALDIVRNICEISGKRIIYLDFLMTRDRQQLNSNYDKLAEMLCSELEKNDAAMLCLGDISIYSTFSYIAERVVSKGYRAEWCPGVTSFCAAASVSRTPLASGNRPFVVIPWGAEDMELLLKLNCTKVIMKAGAHSGELLKKLDELGLSDKAAAVENCGLSGEMILRKDEIADNCGYFTVFIVEGNDA